eukprot:2958559-Rhodomonas_salina.1
MPPSWTTLTSASADTERFRSATAASSCTCSSPERRSAMKRGSPPSCTHGGHSLSFPARTHCCGRAMMSERQ